MEAAALEENSSGLSSIAGRRSVPAFKRKTNYVACPKQTPSKVKRNNLQVTFKAIEHGRITLLAQNADSNFRYIKAGT